MEDGLTNKQEIAELKRQNSELQEKIRNLEYDQIRQRQSEVDKRNIEIDRSWQGLGPAPFGITW